MILLVSPIESTGIIIYNFLILLVAGLETSSLQSWDKELRIDAPLEYFSSSFLYTASEMVNKTLKVKGDLELRSFLVLYFSPRLKIRSRSLCNALCDVLIDLMIKHRPESQRQALWFSRCWLFFFFFRFSINDSSFVMWKYMIRKTFNVFYILL